jgi:dihydroneopterin aldolase
MTPRSIHAAGVNRREALLFEAGIKLGGVFHQYLGIPLSARTAPGLARAIENAIGLQPYVRAVRVRLRPARGGPLGPGRFAYRYLTAEMLDVRLTLRDGPVTVRARLAYRPALRYPLMRVVRASGPARSAPRPGRRRGRSARRTATSAGSGEGRRTPRGRARSSRRRGSRRTPA